MPLPLSPKGMQMRFTLTPMGTTKEQRERLGNGPLFGVWDAKKERIYAGPVRKDVAERLANFANENANRAEMLNRLAIAEWSKELTMV